MGTTHIGWMRASPDDEGKFLGVGSDGHIVASTLPENATTSTDGLVSILISPDNNIDQPTNRPPHAALKPKTAL